MNALKALSSLSPEEKNFLKTKQIAASNTVDGWIAFFRKLKEFDAKGDATRKQGASIGCLGLVIAFVGFFLLGFGFGFVVIPIGVLLGIAGLAIYLYLKSYDISSGILSHKLMPMLLVLREEIHPQEQLKLKLDLRGFSTPEKLIKQNPKYASGRYHEVTDSFYRDPWFHGETVFWDGTRLIWSVEDFVKSQKKYKRNPRGKVKSKTKDKHRSFISMQIGMHNKKYSIPEKVKEKTPTFGAIRTKEADDYGWMSIRKMIKHQGGQTFATRDFLNAIATAYARATPVTGGKKR